MDRKKTLTIFTPTYNRAYTLPKCYEMLKKQSCTDFVWLVVDDGSTDETKELIESYQRENIVEIVYHYQKNKGMHGAHNAGIRLADTLLWTICDSDDYFTENAVEKIIDTWERKSNLNRHAGLICKISDQNNNILSEFPANREEISTYELNYTLGIRSDFRPIYRLSLVKQDYFPLFEDEHYMPCGYKYIENEGDMQLLIIDEALYYVQYLDDGCTNNKVKQFFEYPLGFLFVRTKMLSILREPRHIKRGKIQYLASCILARQNIFKGALSTSDCFLLLIPAYVYYIVICFRYIKQYKRIPYRKKKRKDTFNLINEALSKKVGVNCLDE